MLNAIFVFPRLPQSSNITVDIFITHTAADPDPHLHNYTNEYYRKAQVEELMTTYVNKSTADVVLLGGDFNAGPIKKEGMIIYMGSVTVELHTMF